MGAMPDPRRMLDVGQCATPAPAEGGDLCLADVHGAGEEDIGADPAEALHVRHWAVAARRDAERLFVDSLGKVRVQMDAVRTGEVGGLSHQPLGDAERRAGRARRRASSLRGRDRARSR
jgi:hypothetical protein